MMAGRRHDPRRSSSLFEGSQFSVESARWMQAPKSDISTSSSSSSSSNSSHVSCSAANSNASYNSHRLEVEVVQLPKDPPVDWEKLAMALRFQRNANGEGETVEDLRKRKTETCQRLLANFNHLATKVRELRLASLSQRQTERLRDALNSTQESGETTLLIDSEDFEELPGSGQRVQRPRWGRRTLVLHKLKTKPVGKTRAA